MPQFHTQPMRRRSLLAKRDERVRRDSLGRSLAIANAIVVTVTVVLLLATKPGITLTQLATSALVTLAFTNPITILAHFGSNIVGRRAASRPRIVRMLWMILTWMLAGGIGSTIGFAILSLFGIELPLSRQTWSMALLSNGLIAIIIGAFVLLFESIGQRLRRRSDLDGQGELLASELAAARNVQRSLLPAEDIRIHGFDISGATAPAVEIGGDYYDYLSFADGSKGIIVADAAGKGIPAALVMAKFQGMAQALSIHVASPTEFFVGLNDTLRVRLDRRNFITVGMLTIDFDDRLAFYRAGHNPLLLFSARTGTTTFCRPQGMALGLAHGATVSDALEAYRFEMENGDVAVIYSDGINEAVNAESAEYGDERLAAIVRASATPDTPASQIRAAILDDIAGFVADAPPHDDMTVVVLRRVRFAREGKI